MKQIIFLQLVFIFLSVSVYSQNKEEKKLIIETIKVQDEKLTGFIKNLQVDSIVEMFSPNCHLAREFNEIIEGRDNVRALYNKDLKSGMKIVSCKFEVIEHKVYDDLVLEIGTNIIEYSKGPNKILYRDNYNYMFIWKKSKEGKYRIRSAFWNSIKNPCD